MLSPLLRPAGFEPVARARRWVRARAPLRDIFEVILMKGAGLVPRWGISVDFVPHVKGESVRSHRTNKAAVLDITFDPVDFFSDWQRNWELSGLHGERGMRRDAERILPTAVRRALDWLNSFDGDHLLERIEEHRLADRRGNRFMFDNYVQQPLARAFVLARSGRQEEARAALKRWAEAHVPGRIAKRLHAMLDAQSTSGD